MVQFKAWDHTHGHVTLLALVAGGLASHPLFVRTYGTVVLFSFSNTAGIVLYYEVALGKSANSW